MVKCLRKQNDEGSVGLPSGDATIPLTAITAEDNGTDGMIAEKGDH